MWHLLKQFSKQYWDCLLKLNHCRVKNSNLSKNGGAERKNWAWWRKSINLITMRKISSRIYYDCAWIPFGRDESLPFLRRFLEWKFQTWFTAQHSKLRSLLVDKRGSFHIGCSLIFCINRFTFLAQFICRVIEAGWRFTAGSERPRGILLFYGF